MAVMSELRFNSGDLGLQVLNNAAWDVGIFISGAVARTGGFGGNALAARNGSVAFDFPAPTPGARQNRAPAFGHSARNCEKRTGLPQTEAQRMWRE